MLSTYKLYKSKLNKHNAHFTMPRRYSSCSIYLFLVSLHSYRLTFSLIPYSSFSLSFTAFSLLFLFSFYLLFSLFLPISNILLLFSCVSIAHPISLFSPIFSPFLSQLYSLLSRFLSPLSLFLSLICSFSGS